MGMPILSTIGSLLLVLAMIVGCALVYRLIQGRGLPKMSKSRKRLQLIETMMLDNRNKLILVQCDEEEHLVLVGQASQSVVKSSKIEVANSSRRKQNAA